MLDVVIVLLLGIMPPILSLWMLHRFQANQRPLSVSSRLKALPPADTTHIEGFGYVIGMVSCKYNARSPHLRCAINPSGPCQDCRHYEKSL